ncbi:hypothetical protein ACLOJK_022775 [Asimina triloba]
MILSKNLESIKVCYEIPERIELLALKPGETFKDYHLGCICLNEFMFKVGVRVPFEFGVAELLADWDAAWLEWDDAVENVEATIMAKRGLERTLEEADAKVTSLGLGLRRAEASGGWLSK